MLFLCQIGKLVGFLYFGFFCSNFVAFQKKWLYSTLSEPAFFSFSLVLVEKNFLQTEKFRNVGPKVNMRLFLIAYVCTKNQTSGEHVGGSSRAKIKASRCLIDNEPHYKSNESRRISTPSQFLDPELSWIFKMSTTEALVTWQGRPRWWVASYPWMAASSPRGGHFKVKKYNIIEHIRGAKYLFGLLTKMISSFLRGSLKVS